LFINIHTHQPASANETAVINIYETFKQVTAKGLFSIGIHPCFAAHANLEELKEWSTHKHVVAIGECGLDKLCATDFLLQQQLFEQQIVLANSLQKPLLIHCVKAWDEVLNILQACKVPVIFHGFNKSKELALQLTAKGYYLSFGKALQHERIKQVMAFLPPTQLLLETDTAEISINTIYKWAAEAMQIDLNALSLQIEKNATAVFGLNELKHDN
jgi:TatD DNase family protein